MMGRERCAYTELDAGCADLCHNVTFTDVLCCPSARTGDFENTADFDNTAEPRGGSNSCQSGRVEKILVLVLFTGQHLYNTVETLVHVSRRLSV